MPKLSEEEKAQLKRDLKNVREGTFSKRLRKEKKEKKKHLIDRPYKATINIKAKKQLEAIEND